jgi:hypothetical protein
VKRWHNCKKDRYLLPTNRALPYPSRLTHRSLPRVRAPRSSTPPRFPHCPTPPAPRRRSRASPRPRYATSPLPRASCPARPTRAEVCPRAGEFKTPFFVDEPAGACLGAKLVLDLGAPLLDLHSSARFFADFSATSPPATLVTLQPAAPVEEGAAGEGGHDTRGGGALAADTWGRGRGTRAAAATARPR